MIAKNITKAVPGLTDRTIAYCPLITQMDADFIARDHMFLWDVATLEFCKGLVAIWSASVGIKIKKPLPASLCVGVMGQ